MTDLSLFFFCFVLFFLIYLLHNINTNEIITDLSKLFQPEKHCTNVPWFICWNLQFVFVSLPRGSRDSTDSFKRLGTKETGMEDWVGRSLTIGGVIYTPYIWKWYIFHFSFLETVETSNHESLYQTVFQQRCRDAFYCRGKRSVSKILS